MSLLRRPRRNLLTVREWSQREGVAPATARKWIRAGLIRALVERRKHPLQRLFGFDRDQ